MFGTRNGSVWRRGALVWNCACRGIGWGVCFCALPLGTPLGHWPLKCFPTAANEWKSPLSAGRVGRKSIRPQMFGTRNGSVCPQGALVYNCPSRGIGWGVCNTPLPLGTPLGHPPIKWFPTAANEWRSPLSVGRVGAYCIRPRCSKQETAARVRKAPIKWFPTAAPLGHWPLKCFPTTAPSGQRPL